jgi:integrase/recombinase XerD
MNAEQLPAVIIEQAGEVEPIPAVVAEAGGAAGFAWEEFFLAEIRNPHTRRAYRHAVRLFLAWCEAKGLALRGITPGQVGKYFDRHRCGIPTKKQHLAALRRFFDKLVLRHVVPFNPAAAVRGERYQVIEGRTPEITAEQAGALLKSIDTGSIIGLRDRAIITTLVFTLARVGAVAGLKTKDFARDASEWTLRLHEKGGKIRDIPVRHDLERTLFSYLEAAGLTDASPDSPLFRSVAGKSGKLTGRGMLAGDIGQMVKRRLKAAGLPERLSPHSFRVAVITDLLAQGVPLEDVQNLAGHADPRTTRLYDRRQRKVSRGIVDRISISIPLE